MPDYDWLTVRRIAKIRFQELAKEAGMTGVDYFESLLPPEIASTPKNEYSLRSEK